MYDASDTCEIRDIWAAAYLLAQGCELMGALPMDERRCRFLFRTGVNNAAYQLLREYREGTNTTVSATAYRDAYRTLFGKSKDALRLERDYAGYEGITGYGNEHTHAA